MSPVPCSMRQSGNPCSRLERTLGLVVLLCLAAVTVGVLLKQASFNPAVLVAQTLEGQRELPAGSTVPATDFIVPFPDELEVFGPVESFTPENLYDKIDGKAELYLAAGVVGMRCQRFALKPAGEQWLEWFVYDMGTMPQAFSVFSTQRRTEGESV